MLYFEYANYQYKMKGCIDGELHLGMLCAQTPLMLCGRNDSKGAMMQLINVLMLYNNSQSYCGIV